MESCTSPISPAESLLHNGNISSLDKINSNIQIKKEQTILENDSKNKTLRDSVILNTNDKNELINSPSATSFFSENELKEIEKAYQIVNYEQSGKIRRIDPSRFLHSLPDGSCSQLQKPKKYTTIYTSNFQFPIDDNNINNNLTENNKIKENENSEIALTNNINTNTKTTNNNNTSTNINTTNNNTDINININKSNNNYINKDFNYQNHKTKNDRFIEKNNNYQVNNLKRDVLNPNNPINYQNDINVTYRNLMPKFTDMVQVKKINFPMIIDILNGKRTKVLYERHISIIEKLVKIINESMKVEYVPWLIDIIENIRQKIIDGGDILVKSLINLIESIKIYEFLYNSKNPLEINNIKLLNTILKTITIPNHPELCYCILNIISNFSVIEKGNTPIPPIDPPILCKPLSPKSLNLYFNLYYFKHSTKSFHIISQSKVMKYLLNSPYISTNSEVQLPLLLTLKMLLFSDDLCDKFLNCNGMNLLCKYINSITNNKIYYNVKNNSNENLFETPVTPHQSIGDLNQNDKIIEYINNNNNFNTNNENSHHSQSLNNDENNYGSFKLNETNNTLPSVETNILNEFSKLKNIKIDYDSLYIIIEIFIYLTDSKKRNDSIVQIAHKESLFYLKNIYEQLCTSINREVHKNIRNDLVTFFSRILETTIKSSKKIASIFFKINLTNTIYNELNKCGSIFMNKIILIDYEYKQILLNILCYLCYTEENIILLTDLGFFDYAFKYLTFESNEENKYLNVVQLKQIQIQILDIISLMLQKEIIVKKWFKCNGCLKIFNYLPDAIFNESGLSDGCNIISSTVGLIPATLKVLLYASQLGLYMKTYLGNIGLFKIILEILSNNSISYDIIQLGLMICSSLCHDCMQNKDIFNKDGGIKMLIDMLKYHNPNKVNHHIVLLSTIDCIWKSICGCKKSEFKFFENEGLSLLINLIENNKDIRNHAIGCLLDLMENINARSYVLLWRSRNNCNVGIEQLLINLWTDIENNKGVNKLDGNIIYNTKFPLHSETYIKDTFKLKENIELNKSCVIDEMKEDLRVKIFSIFEILGFNTFDSTLTIDQKICLEYIKKYLDFKVGEIWDEIIDELEIQGVRPVTPDKDYIHAIHRSLNKKGETVQKFQQELTKMKNKLQKTENLYFLEELEQLEKIRYESLKKEKYQNKIKHAFKSQK
ncbi:hypothetical protein BCR32DRAFT_124437 [Anaeromyces robustus]|uniref:Cilia- and flagella-associated protein 69 ARM repeats domain-containing protein n=1 Tax=Anaeromyces robustus TaxID=1754192 RepID=A0A1Y1XR58_9FUNG|nr:hypothetical protein BCR32DRAFT_124437 [Anaeromyces robustus]|eukprot:ORX87804.1 hypothetical protein BCR32DRAFT_124437 [Anaeromyces robustus]